MKILGVTGSIGMGKSTVSNMLREMGIPVHDADATVHILLAAHGGGVAPVAAAFPAALAVNEQGVKYIDRKALGAIVFADPQQRKVLEDILHALIRSDTDAFIAQKKAQGHALVALDIPLLYETGGEKRVDAVLCVTAPADVQRARVLARPGMTQETFERVLAVQMPDAEKRKRADHIVETDQGMEHTRAVLKDLVAQLTPPPSPPKGGFKTGLALVFATLMLLANPAAAQNQNKDIDATLVELFTAQGCGNCTQAEATLATAAQWSDAIVLAFHVDSYDRKVGFDGSWKDTFARPDWTRRQQAYARLSGPGNTGALPQFVVDGRKRSMATSTNALADMIATAHARRNVVIDMSQRREKDGVMAVRLKGTPTPGLIGGKTVDVFLARYIRSAETRVTSGENKGKTLNSVHIVEALVPLGTWYGGTQDFRYPLSNVTAQESCVIYLQDRFDERILGAQECMGNVQ